LKNSKEIYSTRAGRAAFPATIPLNVGLPTGVAETSKSLECIRHMSGILPYP